MLCKYLVNHKFTQILSMAHKYCELFYSSFYFDTMVDWDSMGSDGQALKVFKLTA